MRSLSSLRASRKRRGRCTAFRAHIRRFPLGARIANARALPCPPASRNAATHVAGRNGLLGRGAFGDPDCPGFVATLCLDGPNGGSAKRGLAGELPILLRFAGTGCRGPIARQGLTPHEAWPRFAAVKVKG